MQHVAALGSASKPWELFVDGYDSSGNRVYDSVSGQTCHQCRQKTLGRRTTCACCASLQGVFCGDCLFMRYGENVEEAAADPGASCARNVVVVGGGPPRRRCMGYAGFGVQLRMA